MAVTVDTSIIFSFSTATSSDSRSYTVGGSANLLVVLCGSRNTGRNWTITYNGASLSHLGTSNIGGSQSEVDVYYLVNPTTGAHTLASSWNLTSDIVMCACSFNGVDTTTPFRSQGANSYVDDSGNPSTTASSTVTSTANDLGLDWLQYADTTGDAPTLGSGQTLLQTLRQGTTNGTRGTASTKAGSSSITMSETFPVRQYNHRVMSLQAATAGGATAHNLSLLGVGS